MKIRYNLECKNGHKFIFVQIRKLKTPYPMFCYSCLAQWQTIKEKAE